MPHPRVYMKNTANIDLVFWDLETFREVSLFKYLNHYAKTAFELGGAVFSHTPEHFTNMDALYINVFYRLARSPFVKYFIMDSNFWDRTGVSNGEVGAVLAGTRYLYPDKEFHFEAAVERLDFSKKENVDMIFQGLQRALDNGIDDISLTNTFQKPDSDVKLLEQYWNEYNFVAPSSSKPKYVVFTPYYSYYTYYDRFNWKNYDSRIDGLKDNLYKGIAKHVPKGEKFLVLADLSIFTTEMAADYAHRIFIEPPVLSARDQERLAEMKKHIEWTVFPWKQDNEPIVLPLLHW